MKKFIFGLVMALLTIGGAQAQSTASGATQLKFKGVAGTTVDTVLTNAVTKIHKLDVLGYYPAFSVSARVLKASGTVAGKIIFEISDDGILYKRAGGADSLVLTNVAQQGIFIDFSGWKHRFIRATTTTTGTQVSSVNILGTIKK